MKIILDTDPGIDDALTILLLAASGEIDLLAITTTHGNNYVDQCYLNALAIADLAKLPNIPIAKGASEPLRAALQIASETHGTSGLGYANLPPSNRIGTKKLGFEVIVDLVKANPGEITILAIGPLTNIALAFLNHPEIIPLVKNIVSMAGSFEFAGNASPTAEYNVFCDPESYQVVINSGVDLTIIPLDVTYQCIFTTAHLAELTKARKEVYDFVRDSTKFYMEFHDEYQGISGCAINDPLAAVYLYKPEVVEVADYFVNVALTKNIYYGKTSADRFNTLGKKPNAKVALKVNTEMFFTEFINRINQLTN